MIPSIFNLSDLCQIDGEGTDKQYYFKGMICYWGAHYFCFIRHITKAGEFWVEYNDKRLYRIPSWKWLVDDCVSSCCTPIFLMFDNIKTLDDPTHLNTLGLTEEAIITLKDTCFRESRIVDAGKIDMSKSNRYGSQGDMFTNFCSMIESAFSSLFVCMYPSNTDANERDIVNDKTIINENEENKVKRLSKKKENSKEMNGSKEMNESKEINGQEEIEISKERDSSRRKKNRKSDSSKKEN